MSYFHRQAPTSGLSPNPWNSNVVSPENEAKLDESLRRFGLYKPIICRTLKDGSLQILGGQHRWESAIRVGIETVPIVDMGAIEDERAKEISLVDNGRYGVDDATQLAEVLKSLGSNEDLSAFLPYSQKELDGIFATTELDLDDLNVKDDTDVLDAGPEDSPVGPVAQLMRFKVPTEDAERIALLIERTMRAQGFSKADALTNAGDALVYLLLSPDQS